MPRKSRKNIGLIGLGIIGSRVATALRGGGFQVYVWNRTPHASPNFLGSPADVAELCDVIQIFVADAQALFSVLDAMAEKLTDRHVIICSSTVGPEATVEAAKAVEEHGAKFLDAPFTGSKTAAEARQLVYYIGGDDDVLRRAEPALRASSKAIVKVGKIGQAATVKVATNMIAAVGVQTLAEALAIVKQSGISPLVMADVLEHHGARSLLLDMKLGSMIHREYEPHFSMKNMFKDVQLAIHIANALDIDIPATTATAGVMYGGLSRGWADLDYAALAKVYETLEEAPATPAPEPAVESAPVEPQPAHAEPARESLINMTPPPRADVEKTESAAPPAPEILPDGEAPANHAAAPQMAESVQTAEETNPTDEEKKPSPPMNRIRRWFNPENSA